MTSCERLGVHLHPCSALIHGECKNGFPVGRGCQVGHVVSPADGDRWWQLMPIPHCLDEEFVLTQPDSDSGPAVGTDVG